jgi:hypothetical protein
VLLVQTRGALALSAEEVFEKVARSLVVIVAKEAENRSLTQGSGVIIRQGVVATNCHVVKSGTALQVKADKRTFQATLLFADVGRDLCLLHVDGLLAPPADLGTVNNLRPGARVYAVGAPRGLELTISEGLVSGLRELEESTIIQTSAPISPGSSGGGLFDSSGRLVGITTFMLAESQNINFALPVDWLKSVQARSTAARGTYGRGIDAPSRPPSQGKPDDSWLDDMSSRVRVFISSPEDAREFMSTLSFEADRAGLDRQMVLAVIERLSQFRKFAVSASGAQGYMQVMPIWVTQIGTPGQNLFNLRTNLRYGCTILRHYLDKNEGSVFRALSAYHNQALGKPDELVGVDSTFAWEVQEAWTKRWRVDSE